MDMRLTSDREILDQGTRKAIIEEIRAGENQKRRQMHFERQLIHKDQTRHFVEKMLLEWFDDTTVRQMGYAMTNVSIVRKIIDKLSRVYSHGVERVINNDDKSTEKLQTLVDILDFNSKMKDENRLLKLHRNTVCYIKPCPIFQSDGVTIKWRPRITPMSPHLYDAIEDFSDRTQPIVYILSNFEQLNQRKVSVEPSKEGRTLNTPVPKPIGNRQDEKLADKKEDEGLDEGVNQRFIWWSDNFHFTTNGKSELVDEFNNPIKEVIEEEILNPIGEMPLVNFAIGQDNSFWAEGGDDLINTGILINSLLSNMNHIAVMQGYGQLVAIGKNLPRNYIMGPDKVFIFEYEDKEEPKPEVKFISANPQLAELRAIIDMQIALLLTTNNLSTSGVSTQLNAGQNVASGIALIIDKSESQEDVKDQQQVFLDNEPDIWRITNKWNIFYAADGSLEDEFTDLLLPDKFEEELLINFGKPQTILSESEQLANLDKRKGLGLNTMVDLMKMDQPELGDTEAEEKLAKISEEKRVRLVSTIIDENTGNDQNTGHDENTGHENDKQNDSQRNRFVRNKEDNKSKDKESDQE